LVNTWLPYIKTGLVNDCPGLKLVLKTFVSGCKTITPGTEMKPYYQITAEEIGIVLLRKRKIAKALRRWLREKGLSYEYNFYIQ
jgi:hypothetical protein